jgi:hypothetical protein
MTLKGFAKWSVAGLTVIFAAAGLLATIPQASARSLQRAPQKSPTGWGRRDPQPNGSLVAYTYTDPVKRCVFLVIEAPHGVAVQPIYSDEGVIGRDGHTQVTPDCGN